MNRTDIINYYLSKMPTPKSYLEIGVRDPKSNFSKILANNKDGVDPNISVKCNYVMTSDAFFSFNTKKYNLIFVDGLHLYEQAYRDVINAEKFLEPEGIIIMHDCNPPTEWHQRENYDGGHWNGTVWKAFVRLRKERSDFEMFVVDTDWGIGIIKPNKRQDILKYSGDIYNYKNFETNRKMFLNLMSESEWKEKEQNSA